VTVTEVTHPFWNRREPLTVRWTTTVAQALWRLSLVQELTGRTVVSRLVSSVGLTNRYDWTGHYHLDPGPYFVEVSTLTGSARDRMRTRVVGRPRTLAAGGFHGLVIGPDAVSGPGDDYVWGWGRSENGQVGAGTTAPYYGMRRTGLRAVAVAAGDLHSLALTADGTVYGWGEGSYYRTGVRPAQEAAKSPITTPTLAMKTPSNDMPELGSKFIAIAAGRVHSMALREDGRVVAWGGNPFGQVGTDTDRTSIRNPKFVLDWEGEPLTDVVAIAAGQDASLALRADGSIWGWGLNSGGVLGPKVAINRSVDHAIPLWDSMTDFIGMEIGGPSTSNWGLYANAERRGFVVAMRGIANAWCGWPRLWGWGSNDFGQLDPDREEELLEAPVLLGELALAVLTDEAGGALGCGGSHRVKIDRPDLLRAHGDDSRGQLGTQQPLEMKHVSPDDPDRYSFLFATGTHATTFVRAWDWWEAMPRPVVIAWGSNDFWQVRKDSTDVVREPVIRPLLED
jgi:alpha-tubulin suppressor-like RCC1 family protein